MAGVVALLNQYLTSKSLWPTWVGQHQPALYRLAQSTNNIFHDITADNAVRASWQPDCVEALSVILPSGYDRPAVWLDRRLQLITQWNNALPHYTVHADPPSD